MKRRTALGLMATAITGALIKAVKVHGEDSVWAFNETDSSDIMMVLQPNDIVFHESGVRNLVVNRSNGKTITIPFTEIFDALEED